MEIDSFQSAVESYASLKKQESSTHLTPNNKIEHDSLSVSTDCDSYTADSNSLCDFSASTLSEGKTLETRSSEKSRPNSMNSICDKNISDSKSFINHSDTSRDNSNKYYCKKISECRNISYSGDNFDCIEEKCNSIVNCKYEDYCNDIKCNNCINRNEISTKDEINVNIEAKSKVELSKEEKECNANKMVTKDIVSDKEISSKGEISTKEFSKSEVKKIGVNEEIQKEVINKEESTNEFNNKIEKNEQNYKTESINKNIENKKLNTLITIDESTSLKVISIQNKLIQEFTEDALSIFKKYIALEAPEAINCPPDIRKEVIENICNTEKVLSSDCFQKVQKYVFDILNKEYFDAFLGSDYFCKYQIDILTSGNVVLEDILYNETALFYFMEYLEQENCRYLLDFWVTATNFQQQLHDQKEFFDPVEAQNDAVVLYDKYFSLQALCPLGFSDKVRFVVEQNICGENGLILDCFHLPLKIIEQVLEKNYLKPFLASQLFYKYLSELINTIQCNCYPNIHERSKSIPSDCSSEKSFSTNNTFLAMEIPVKKVKKKGADMNIDIRQLYDPDSLWKRKKQHRLSFGRVTEYGRFETDVEPDPDKKNESKLKNVVRKLVHIDEDKQKEEMAWQVAEMIVKDITNITLHQQMNLEES